MEEVEQQPQVEEQAQPTETDDKQIQINLPKSKSQIKKEAAKQRWLDDKQKRKDRQKVSLLCLKSFLNELQGIAQEKGKSRKETFRKRS